MSYLVNALKQSQQAGHSEQDHLAYQHQKQLKLYRTMILGLSAVVLVGGFAFVGYLSGHYLQSSLAQPAEPELAKVEQSAEKPSEGKSEAAQRDVANAPVTAATPQIPSSQPVTVNTALPVQAQPVTPAMVNNAVMNPQVQYQWMSVQIGVDASGQPVYRQQLVPVMNQQVVNAPPQQAAPQAWPQSQASVQAPSTVQGATEDLSQYRVLGKPLNQPLEQATQDPELAGVSKELQEAFAQAVADTENAQPHNVTASSKDSARATPVELLPDALQQSLPTLRYQAHIYATDPEKRWIKLNNRELYEGDNIGALKLLEITPEQALFNFDGYEFSMKAMQDWLP
ncbi:general secretion pathway protein GspB [Pseudoalteromonas sp. MMG022]|uniref:general secretion pathway protein GspB n=1 Tax=Pseudoalteromonas sp. MMG022 TaxID=2909978 RepID=UPI001F017229|nr:general secretion pathway protein GspB [Pseudoalteromonas sp. MMG022]MCF6435895.1 general secretion pathway protein GspB [Pseudoalteromonas sp. MMG022]